MNKMGIFEQVQEIKREVANWLYDRVISGVDEEDGSMDWINFEDQDMQVFIHKVGGGNGEVCEYDVDIEFGNVPYSCGRICSSMDVNEIFRAVSAMLFI